MINQLNDANVIMIIIGFVIIMMVLYFIFLFMASNIVAVRFLNKRFYKLQQKKAKGVVCEHTGCFLAIWLYREVSFRIVIQAVRTEEEFIEIYPLWNIKKVIELMRLKEGDICTFYYRQDNRNNYLEKFERLERL